MKKKVMYIGILGFALLIAYSLFDGDGVGAVELLSGKFLIISISSVISSFLSQI